MNSLSSVDQQFIEQLTQVIQENLDKEEFGVDELARQLGMSRSTLHRKVKTIVKKSVSEFIREMRLKKAHELLEKKIGTVSEIAFRVGFSSVSYFNRSFGKHFGYTPGEVLKGLHPLLQKEENETADKKKLKRKSFQWLAISFILSASVAFMVFGLNKHERQLTHKNIAILPVQVDPTSEKITNEIQWIPRELINKLNKIPEISVVSYSSIKNYDWYNKSNKKIGKDLLVDYFLESHFTLLKNQSKLHVELIDISNDSSIWSNIFNVKTDSSDFGNSFQLEENLAVQVANALCIRLNSNQKQQVEKLLTENEEALRLYNLASNLLERPDINRNNVDEAKKLLETAISLDSTFSDAYSKLGKIYIGNLRYTPGIFLAENYLDSSVMFNEKALTFDEFNQEAIKNLCSYYTEKGITGKAREMEARLSPSIKNYLFYQQEFGKYTVQNDYFNQLQSFYNYLNVKPVDETVPWWMYENVYNTFNNIGFPNLARKYSNLKYIIKYKNKMPEDCFETLLIDEFNGDYESGFQRAKRLIEDKKWPDGSEHLFMSRYWERKGNFKKACYYLDELEQKEGPWGESWLEMFSDKSRWIYPFGYCYLKTGQKEKADFYFNRFIKKYTSEIELNAYFARNNYTYFEIAMVHAAMGNNQECVERLNYLCLQKNCPRWFILEMKNSPWFDNIRETSEFRNLLKSFEKKYQKEHNRIAKILVLYENEIL